MLGCYLVHRLVAVHGWWNHCWNCGVSSDESTTEGGFAEVYPNIRKARKEQKEFGDCSLLPIELYERGHENLDDLRTIPAGFEWKHPYPDRRFTDDNLGERP